MKVSKILTSYFLVSLLFRIISLNVTNFPVPLKTIDFFFAHNITISFLVINSFLFAVTTTSILYLVYLSKISSKVLLAASVIILFSPWINFLTLFHIKSTIAVIVFVLFSVLYFKPSNIRFGKLFIVLLLMVSLLFGYLSSENNYLLKLRPEILASEIDNRQKVDFLSTNRAFVLPSVIRRFTYNKPMLGVDKVLGHSISLIDPEQLVFMFKSFDISRLSGVLPKGSFPALYFWELPLILFGVYIAFKNKDSKLVWLAIAGSVGVLFFEKKDFIQGSALIIPAAVLLEAKALDKLLKRKLRFQFVIIAIVIVGFLTTFHTLLFDQFKYRTSHDYFHQQVGLWLQENNQNYINITVTNRFGPTDLSYAYYSDMEDNIYAGRVIDEDSTKIENITFRSFQFPDEPYSSEQLYIGFPGEFSKSKEMSGLRESAIVLKEIEAPDEIVGGMGENIWIVTFK